MSDSTSSSDTSSLSSGSSSEDSDSDDDMDDTKLLLEIRNKLNRPVITTENRSVPQIAVKVKTEDLKEEIDDVSSPIISKDVEARPSTIDERLKEQFNLEKTDSSSLEIPVKRRRIGLVQEIIISVCTDYLCCNLWFLLLTEICY